MASKTKQKNQKHTPLRRTGAGKGGGATRSAATVRRLKMYKNRPKRNNKGKILKHEFQSKDLPCTRIQPDRRYFMNTRVISQKDLENFRDKFQSGNDNNNNCVMLKKENKKSLSSSSSSVMNGVADVGSSER